MSPEAKKFRFYEIQQEDELLNTEEGRI